MIECPASHAEHSKSFVFPDVEYEMGEIERTAEDYFPGVDKNEFAKKFLEQANMGKLEPFREDEWQKLENSDSPYIRESDWERVKELAEGQNPPRDWQAIRARMEKGEEKAPIIVRKGNGLHLVSGNTRLMVSRALGVTPDVLIVDMTEYTR